MGIMYTKVLSSHSHFSILVTKEGDMAEEICFFMFPVEPSQGARQHHTRQKSLWGKTHSKGPRVRVEPGPLHLVMQHMIACSSCELNGHLI